MKIFGLIGYPLSHSFSKKYFSDKFAKEGIEGCQYDLFEIDEIEKLKSIITEAGTSLKGLNVTIPYKQAVIPFLKEIDPAAQRIGAINVIKPVEGGLKGYNSDYYGFLNSLKGIEPLLSGKKALILGTGGASKAVKTALEDEGVEYKYVSRKSSEGVYSYEEITPEIIKEYSIIINSTPLGMSPNVDDCPSIPYEALTSAHILFDLVYNPLETKFMKLGVAQGAKVKNGLEMLELQAEKAWEIWNN